MVYRINQEAVTSTGIFLSTEVSSQERETSQRFTVVQKDRLNAFEGFDRHGRVHVRSQKGEVQTENMKK